MLQLLPIKSPQIIEKYNSIFADIYCLWSLRQTDDKTFIILGECSEDNMKLLKLRKIDPNSIPLDATVIFAENKLKYEYNACKLSQLNHFEIRVEAIDYFLTQYQYIYKHHVPQGLAVPLLDYHYV